MSFRSKASSGPRAVAEASEPGGGGTNPKKEDSFGFGDDDPGFEEDVDGSVDWGEEYVGTTKGSSVKGASTSAAAAAVAGSKAGSTTGAAGRYTGEILANSADLLSGSMEIDYGVDDDKASVKSAAASVKSVRSTAKSVRSVAAAPKQQAVPEDAPLRLNSNSNANGGGAYGQRTDEFEATFGRGPGANDSSSGGGVLGKRPSATGSTSGFGGNSGVNLRSGPPSLADTSDFPLQDDMPSPAKIPGSGAVGSTGGSTADPAAAPGTGSRTTSRRPSLSLSASVGSQVAAGTGGPDGQAAAAAAAEPPAETTVGGFKSGAAIAPPEEKAEGVGRPLGGRLAPLAPLAGKGRFALTSEPLPPLGGPKSGTIPEDPEPKSGLFAELDPLDSSSPKPKPSEPSGFGLKAELGRQDSTSSSLKPKPSKPSGFGLDAEVDPTLTSQTRPSMDAGLGAPEEVDAQEELRTQAQTPPVERLNSNLSSRSRASSRPGAKQAAVGDSQEFPEGAWRERGPAYDSVKKRQGLSFEDEDSVNEPQKMRPSRTATATDVGGTGADSKAPVPDPVKEEAAAGAPTPTPKPATPLNLSRQASTSSQRRTPEDKGAGASSKGTSPGASGGASAGGGGGGGTEIQADVGDDALLSQPEGEGEDREELVKLASRLSSRTSVPLHRSRTPSEVLPGSGPTKEAAAAAAAAAAAEAAAAEAEAAKKKEAEAEAARKKEAEAAAAAAAAAKAAEAEAAAAKQKEADAAAAAEAAAAKAAAEKQKEAEVAGSGSVPGSTPSESGGDVPWWKQKAANKAPPQVLGVSLAVLRAFVQQLPDPAMSTRDCVRKVIAPATKDKGCRYIDLLDGAAFKGPARLYVAHAWGRPFVRLVEAVLAYAVAAYPEEPEDAIYVFLDVMCVDQNGAPSRSGSDSLTQSQSALSACEGPTLLCLDPKGEVLGRAWVLWEAWRGAAGSGGLRVVCPGFLKVTNVVAALNAIDPNTSRATRPEDRSAIVADLQAAGALTGFKETLKKALLDSTVEEADAYKAMTPLPTAAYANALHRAAVMCQATGLLEMAATLQKRALDVLIEAGGAAPDPLDPDPLIPQEVVGAAYCSLGESLSAQRSWKAAEGAYRQAHDILQKELGEHHPDTVHSSKQLALVLKRQGGFEEAERLYRQAVQAYEAQYGADHPNTAVGLLQLAVLLKKRQAYGEAAKHAGRALTIHETSLGPSAPLTVQNIEFLAEVAKRARDRPSWDMWQAKLKEVRGS